MNLATTEKIISLIVQIITALGTLGSLITAFFLANKEASEDRRETRKVVGDLEEQSVEITEKMRQISASLVESLRFELDLAKAEIIELKEENRKFKKMINEFSDVLSNICNIINRNLRDNTFTEKELLSTLDEIDKFVSSIEDKYNI